MTKPAQTVSWVWVPRTVKLGMVTGFGPSHPCALSVPSPDCFGVVLSQAGTALVGAELAQPLGTWPRPHPTSGTVFLDINLRIDSDWLRLGHVPIPEPITMSHLCRLGPLVRDPRMLCRGREGGSLPRGDLGVVSRKVRGAACAEPFEGSLREECVGLARWVPERVFRAQGPQSQRGKGRSRAPPHLRGFPQHQPVPAQLSPTILPHYRWTSGLWG